MIDIGVGYAEHRADLGLVPVRLKVISMSLIKPFGGKLIETAVGVDERESLLASAIQMPRLQLSRRNLCDFEMLAGGGFSPLDGFMNEADFDAVLENMRLADGTLFPLPVTLSVDDDFGLKLDEEIALADRNNNLLATMSVEEIYAPDREFEARLAYGTNDARHPFVAEMNGFGKYNISGKLRVLNLPQHYDFADLRQTPRQTREKLKTLGFDNVVAFQTRNPIHRIHEEMTKRALAEVGGALLIHPVVGMTKPGDVDYFTRVRTYRAMFENYYDKNKTVLSLLPLAMRMAGPREALLHAIIRRNYGANHFIIGRDHAGPGNDSDGKSFYEPFAAQELLTEYADEIGVKPVPFKELVYLADEDRYGEKVNNKGKKTFGLSGTQIREDYLGNGKLIPNWFSRPEVAAILQKAHPPLYEQGFCIWLTGLSGSGKSTTAEILINKLLEHGRSATLLDGDIVRTHLSKGLGFSKEDRDTNVRRIGFVASEIVRHNGVVVCAAVSPYKTTRNECRQMIGDKNFVEVFVDTPLEVCETRDTKGMYKLAREGKIKNFTGIDDPYQMPSNPEITLETLEVSASDNAGKIISYLTGKNFIRMETFLTGNNHFN